MLQSISANKARRFLNSIGHRYTIESVLKSELRVLKTLDYHIMITTPLNYLEAILEILGKLVVSFLLAKPPIYLG